jgi:hypothetical protein
LPAGRVRRAVAPLGSTSTSPYRISTVKHGHTGSPR